MKNKYLFFLPAYLLTLMMYSGCSNLARKGFEIYKEAPLQQASMKVPVNGIFFLKDFVRPTYYYEPPYAFFLYEDGSISSYTMVGISSFLEENFWRNPEGYLKSMRFQNREVGHYKVDGDKFVFEAFTINPGGLLAKHKIIRFEGRVINESNIVLDKVICDWCNRRVDAFPKNGVLPVKKMLYQFYPTPIRPDSNSLWLKKGKWYQKNVWYNNM